MKNKTFEIESIARMTKNGNKCIVMGVRAFEIATLHIDNAKKLHIGDRISVSKRIERETYDTLLKVISEAESKA